ncbi:cyclic nucleotide-gated ion channel 1-like isoform X2 [Quercus robur]|uniref:cyclic nucleotide-gated ion channel 1-like isoform X2 n=1 Tax=Quercus robur TaxID=38942 RepID=UPI002161E06E|nr:cyclic nucleotide-gated ion channel 1-like isoform X2 [Quercus robur]
MAGWRWLWRLFIGNNHDIEWQLPKNGGGDAVQEATTTSKTYILDPREKFLQGWNVVFVLSCVTAVALDPLFFYLPVIIQDKKCIWFDNRLWITVLVLRSFFDFIYLVHIILQFRTGFIDKKLLKSGKPELNTNARKIAKKYLWPRLIFDILAILPIPQVVIPTIFSEMRGTKTSNKVKLLNTIVLFQYVPRVSQIYLSWKKLTRNDKKFDRIILVRASLNFILYILAGHVLGAFWYFFSSQRLAACWHIACENQKECRSSFNCDQNFGNLSFIDDICPIKTENTTSFNFGIFLEALRSGVLDSTDFPQKLFYSFWWGMRNLSSLGQNLQTSNYIWENCFALCISIFGMILFLYFLGNLQMYMQWTTSKSIKKWEKKRMKMKSSKRQKQQKNLKSWMSKHEFHGATKGNINDYIGQRYEADEDVYVETLIPDLPSELQSDVKRHICLDLLKNLTIIKDSGFAKKNHYCLKSATLSNQCSSTSTSTLLGRETQLMQYSCLQKALYGLIQATMVKDLTLDMLSVLKKVSTLEENFLNGFCHLPPTTCTTYQNSLFLQKP